jgi:hypothetical protein
MKHLMIESHLILGISPSSRGFGFAVIEKGGALIDWGVKVVRNGDKNARSLAYVDYLITHWRPYLIAIESTKGSRRGPRVQELSKQIITFALDKEVKVKQLSRQKINRELLHDEKATKQRMAEYLAARFPEELSFRLPRRRRLWTSEDYPMDIFDAVGLAEMVLSKPKKLA